MADRPMPEREDRADAREAAAQREAAVSAPDPAVAEREPAGDDDYVPV